MGTAKTRLARDIGPVEALRLNRTCHARAMKAAAPDTWRTRLCIAPDNDISAHHGHLWPTHFERVPQGKGDLGDRLRRAFQTAPPGPVIVVGVDAPDISAALIKQAFKTLKRADAVFGPAVDGGFWLFGASRTLRRSFLSFSPVRWSSKHALSDLKATFPKTTRIEYISTLVDLDDIDALKRWKNNKKA